MCVSAGATLLDFMHIEGAAIAAVSDPQFGTGTVWPGWTGAQFFGERSRDPDSVALVVLNETFPKVQLLEGVGNSRSIWFEISGLSAREDQVRLLGLAAYAFPPNRLVAERKESWEQRLVELHKLTVIYLW